jgi:hypothetical protein
MCEIMHSFLLSRASDVSDERVEFGEMAAAAIPSFSSPLQGVASRLLECLLEGLYHQLIVGGQCDDGIQCQIM